jgi:hypothetical protein
MCTPKMMFNKDQPFLNMMGNKFKTSLQFIEKLSTAIKVKKKQFTGHLVKIIISVICTEVG